jgi:uncharacterized protein (TIGR03083 family)
MAAVWPIIHGERAALLADLKPLSAEHWETPSLCADWTVRQVLGHMISTARMTPTAFLTGFAGSAFNFTTFAAKGVARETAGSVPDQLAAFESVQSATTHPPGPTDSWLGEAIIHAEDIRRPLGIKREYPLEAVVRVADFYKKSNLIVGARDRIDGLRFTASDIDWTHGVGSEVRGPILSLVLAMTGRSAALADLTGAGVASLRARG